MNKRPRSPHFERPAAQRSALLAPLPLEPSCTGTQDLADCESRPRQHAVLLAICSVDTLRRVTGNDDTAGERKNYVRMALHAFE